MSAVLAYFLDPSQDHGLGSLFLTAFLNMPELGSMSLGKWNELYQTNVKLESNLDNKHYADIELEFLDDGDEKHSILIENKIRETAVKPGQLNGVYEAKKRYFKDEKNAGAKVSVILITPTKEGEKFEKEYSKLQVKGEDFKSRLSWRGNQSSIQKVIQEEIIQKEANGLISPINEYVKHTLKALVNHLNTIGKQQKSHGRRSKKQPEITSSANEVTITVDEYQIVKDRQQYRLIKDGEPAKGKATLREINDRYKLGIQEQLEGGKLLQTYQFAKEVWGKIIERQKD